MQRMLNYLCENLLVVSWVPILAENIEGNYTKILMLDLTTTLRVLLIVCEKMASGNEQEFGNGKMTTATRRRRRKKPRGGRH